MEESLILHTECYFAWTSFVIKTADHMALEMDDEMFGCEAIHTF